MNTSRNKKHPAWTIENHTHIEAELDEFLGSVVGDQRGLLALEGDVQASLAGRALAVDQLHLQLAAARSKWIVPLGTRALLAGYSGPAGLAYAAVDLIRIPPSVTCVVQVGLKILEVGDFS